MKPTTINVQITKCPKQYEAVRIGMDATLEPNETVESAIKAATEQLNAIYVETYLLAGKSSQNAENAAKKEPQTQEPAPAKKELLTMSDPRVQQIVNRIEKNPKEAQETLEKSRKYFDFDADVEKVLTLAAQINK